MGGKKKELTVEFGAITSDNVEQVSRSFGLLGALYYSACLVGMLFERFSSLTV
jgi:hypothetical protein